LKESEVDWKKVMEIAKRLGELDLFVAVNPSLEQVSHRLLQGDRRTVLILVSTNSDLVKFEWVNLDPTTLNFLFKDGVVMEPDTLLASSYDEILTWLGLKQ
jgi:hypothetical protein